ncbi:uncharacterized protein I303_103510 [Kwoniella dejecticola CBS 10117]|uniref:U3 small nucleolar RNA-associated protein 8 n=1 Tax=Kwoniella dejecticola CBS 10117 TaxID=1296121 RepID=A0A1A6A6Y7_9TREE|nr:uncharacterized protein I303_03533 [Kwoniella dejecticola CBS 10117]OBR85820.1 hypothetical protein I303_03533 [Kwoniella dejecticola CBS 10117]
MTSISTPTQLATFSQPHASSSKLPAVTLSPVIGDPGCAVAAVRGDGIWTYDLNTLRPTTSFTVPPSTIFSTSPISYWKTTTKTIPKASTSGSYNGVVEVQEVMDLDENEELDEAGEEDDDDEDGEQMIEEKERITMVGVGKEVWVWKGEDSDKNVISIGKPVHSIHHLSSPTWSNLIVTSSPTAAHLLDDSFQAHELNLPISAEDILTSKIITSTHNAARLVMVDSDGQVSVLKLTLDDQPRVERLTEGKIAESTLNYADISEDGVITALDTSNNLYCREISSLSTSTPTTPLHLEHPSSTPVLLSLPTNGKPTILLPTSHPSPSLLLAIPLSNLPAVLSSTQVSSFTSTGAITHLSILSKKNGILTIGLVLHHLNSDGQGGRNVIYTTEVVLPSKGIGMGMLLGTKEKTQMYLSATKGGEETTSSAQKEETKFIDRLKGLLVKKDDAASVKLVEERINSGTPQNLSEEAVRNILKAVFSSALNDEGNIKGHYSAGIISSLVRRGLVNDSMWQGSLVGDGLLPLGDWNNILLCLQHFHTIPSSTLVKLISSTIYPETGDQSSKHKSIPSLSDILRIIMRSPPSPTFKLDIRQLLSVEDATSVLEQLVSWAEKHVSFRAEVLKGWDVDVNVNVESSLSAAAASVSQMEDKDGIPSLGSVITYANLILDSHLPLFINHSPSHAALEALQSSLIPLMEAQDEYRNLQGPIESILILSRREQAKLREIEAKRSKGKNGKKEGIVSATKLPEEKVGKWKVEELVF